MLPSGDSPVSTSPRLDSSSTVAASQSVMLTPLSLLCPPARLAPNLGIFWDSVFDPPLFSLQRSSLGDLSLSNFNGVTQWCHIRRCALSTHPHPIGHQVPSTPLLSISKNHPFLSVLQVTGLILALCFLPHLLTSNLSHT